MFRRFWARHPRLTDGLLAGFCTLATLAAVVGATSYERAPAAVIAGVVLTLASCVLLFWRRRWPLTVFIASMVPLCVLLPDVAVAVGGPAPVIAIYSLAVHRSSRAAVWALALGSAAVIAIALVWGVVGGTPFGWSGWAIGTVLLLAIGALVGINVGGRKRYVEALIDRSRQLAVERDQQARIAASAERTRIAREMHDIVSHSLTVVVALAEGAIATDDREKSRQASRAVAATAREALSEMRVMLGVLRTDPDAAGDDAPLEPLLELSLNDIVGAARAAGFPVALTVTGAPHGTSAQRLAVLRIVQEGLTNAMRYSHDPSGIRVLTAYSTGATRVVIDNDGVRPGEPSQGAGLGLEGLRERVATLGGSLTAGPSAPDKWRLDAQFPSKESDA